MSYEFKEGDIVKIINLNSPYSGKIGIFKKYMQHGLYGSDCLIIIDSGKSEGPSSFLQLYEATELELLLNGIE